MAADTRARLVAAAETLFGAQGYAGTGLKELTAHAAAPWGSLYHFFPGGKAELGAAALAFAAERYGQAWLRAFAQAGDPAQAVWLMFQGQARILAGGGWRAGCPVAATTQDTASLDETLRLACADAFAAWREIIAQALEAGGTAPERARALANFVLAALEGAMMLARAARDPAPLLEAGAAVRDVLASELRGG